MPSRCLDRLLLEVHQCPTEASRWPAVLEEVCHETGARSAVIQILSIGAERACARWMVRDSESESAREAHDRLMGDDVNPRMRARPRRPLPPDLSIQRDEDF